MSETELLRTALHDRHVALGATMGAEAGWHVPLRYTGPLDEAAEVRRRAGVMDLSHRSRIRIRGDGAPELLARACTHDATRQEDDTAADTLLLNERGGVLDTGTLIRLENFWVFNGAPPCREKTLRHLESLAEGLDARVDDQTLKTTLLAVTGPEAPRILDAVLPFRAGDLPAGAVKFGSLMIARYIAARVSDSGEWGVEVSLPNLVAGQAWRFITEKAGPNAVRPVGLAAADVLRIEAGLCRYGHEFNETIDPLSAGLEDRLHWEHDFLGRDALDKLRARSLARRRVGLVLEAPAERAAAVIPRQGAAVRRADGSEAGAVTSATFSPAREVVLAMAYLSPVAAEVGEKLSVETPAGPCDATVAELPFVVRP
ncbi:MAG TPA: glycine cleavage T C-terminal barrel domain-containing protein [Phycisphaerae bacterium]|nr:glycine cleavage T C-terminal barrel domain-containing protein [Phycisphaerae bacterium]